MRRHDIHVTGKLDQAPREMTEIARGAPALRFKTRNRRSLLSPIRLPHSDLKGDRISDLEVLRLDYVPRLVRVGISGGISPECCGGVPLPFGEVCGSGREDNSATSD